MKTLKLYLIFLILALSMNSGSVYAYAVSSHVVFKSYENNTLTLSKIENKQPSDLFTECRGAEIKVKLRFSRWFHFWKRWSFDYQSDQIKFDAAIIKIKELSAGDNILFTTGGNSLHHLGGCTYETRSLDAVTLKNKLQLFTYISF